MSFLLDEGRSETKKEIVDMLIPGDRSLKELSDEIGVSKQALLKHLNWMEERGVVEGRTEKESGASIKKYSLGNYSAMVSLDERGFAIRFEADSSLDFRFPLVNQIPQKDYREELVKYLEGIVKVDKDVTVVVFGSVSRGEATWKSDIDVAVLSDQWGNKEEESISDMISDISMKDGVNSSMNPHFIAYEELEENDGIVKEIKKDGMIVYTDEKELEAWEKMKRYQNI